MNAAIPFDSVERDLGVLVGFDGSDHAKSALDWAAVKALSSDSVLTVVSIYRLPPLMYTGEPAILVTPEARAKRDHAEKNLDDARKHLRDYLGKVAFLAAEGNPTGGLIDFSARAQMVVIGAHGQGGFVGQLLGSVATALPAHAQCPTVVIPNDAQPGSAQGSNRVAREAAAAPVVAGIDLSERSRMVLILAADQAEHLEAPLNVFAALPLLREWKYWYPDLEVYETTTQLRLSNLRASLEEEIGWLRRRHASLDITVDVELGHPGELLVAKTRAAQLSVIGTRGRGAVKSALLGSVSREVLNRARGPVMVVPTETA